MEQCNLEGAVKFIEDLHKSIKRDKNVPYSPEIAAGKRLLKELSTTFNAQRAVIQQASMFAGAKRISIQESTVPVRERVDVSKQHESTYDDVQDVEDVVSTDGNETIRKDEPALVLKELITLNKQIALDLYGSATTFVTNPYKKAGGSFSYKNNTLTAYGLDAQNERLSHELIHSLQRGMVVESLSPESKEFLYANIDDFKNFKVGVDEELYKDVFESIKFDDTDNIPRDLLEQVYLTSIALGDYNPNNTEAENIESFGREFTAIVGSSPSFRKYMYGNSPAPQKAQFKKLVREIVAAISTVKDLIKKIIVGDPKELVADPNYRKAMKLLDEYISNSKRPSTEAVLPRQEKTTKAPEAGHTSSDVQQTLESGTSSATFDEELDTKLTKKLQELYPEIVLEYTDKDIEESGDARYQRSALGIEVAKRMANTDLGKVAEKLQQLYPSITSTDIEKVISKYGRSTVDTAITSLITLVDNENDAVLPYEYSLVYVDLLEHTTFVSNSINMVARRDKVGKEEAKIRLATSMASYIIQEVNGSNFVNADKLSVGRRIWGFIRKLTKALFGGKDMAEEASSRREVVLAKRLMEGISDSGIRLSPKEGTELVDPSFDFKNQPFAAGIVEDVMDASERKAFLTGSEALAMQGKIYRKQEAKGTDLHDLDFGVDSAASIKKIVKALSEKYSTYEAYNFDAPKKMQISEFAEAAIEKVPALLLLKPLAIRAIKLMPRSNIVTMVVLPKGYKIDNLKRFGSDSKSRIVRYDVLDAEGVVVGSYRADVVGVPNSFRTKLLNEHTTGVKAVLVDLLEDNKSSTAQWVTPNGVTISVSDHKDIFAAKNSLSPFIARDKDIVDFNSFYNTAFKDSKAEFQRTESGGVKGKADLEAKKVLINVLLRTQDTLPHEYAHHYINWFRDAPIVKEAIKKWGSEEALVQAIGEQVVKQKGEALNWWNRFVDWLKKTIDLSKADKEELKNALTDAFLTRQDLSRDNRTTIDKPADKESSQGPYKVSGGRVTNQGQTAAINMMKDWYTNDKTSDTFLLQGRGGTGKTTVINVLLQELGIKPSEVAFATPTNKAKKVIRSANKDTLYAKSEYYTIAQLLGIRPEMDSRGNQIFKEDIYASKPVTDKVLVVDEASMLHSDNYHKLLIQAKANGTRVILMGDNAQLPPIGDPKAPIKSVVFTGNEHNSTKLTELMRQVKDSPIIKFTDKLIRIVDKVESYLGLNPSGLSTAKDNLRKVLFDGDVFTSLEGNDGMVLTDSSFEDLLPSFIADYKKAPRTTKYINFNNYGHANTLSKVNSIRAVLFNERASKEAYIKGEPLVLNTPYTFDVDASGVEGTLDNGEEFTVVSSVVKRKTIDYKVGRKTVTTKGSIEVYEITAADNITGDTYIFNKPTGGKQEVDAFIEEEKANVAAQGMKPASAYRVKAVLAEGLAHGYVINSHKAQGSTYDNVYMDLGNISGQPYSSANDIIKSLYVAASRPRKKLVVIDSRGAGSQLVNTTAMGDLVGNVAENLDTAEASDIIKELDKCKHKGQ